MSDPHLTVVGLLRRERREKIRTRAACTTVVLQLVLVALQLVK